MDIGNNVQYYLLIPQLHEYNTALQTVLLTEVVFCLQKEHVASSKILKNLWDMAGNFITIRIK